MAATGTGAATYGLNDDDDDEECGDDGVECVTYPSVMLLGASY